MLLTCILTALSCMRLAVADGSNGPIVLSKSPPANAGPQSLESFVAYSIEFSSFPDFAGNTSHPNKFSDNLLNNLGRIQGTKPYIRVGGNTQDYALYNASLDVALVGTIDTARSKDYPTTIHIGPSYFQSYNTWPGARYIHGFNLGLGGNNSAGWETLLETVPLACKALQHGKLLWWEYGNEPDLYSTSSQGPVRPSTWNEASYVAQWLNGTRAIRKELSKACPELLGDDRYGFYAPSFAGTNNHLKPVTAWHSGLDTDGNIKIISSHNYIGGATQPGVTLQGTLMNHSSTVHSISSQLAERDALANYSIPFILGETNSLYNEGAPGLSNSFGAGLWGVDFNLWCASQGIRRVHMHQGTNYRYQSWQPIQTDLTTLGTKAPYYGNIAVATFLGNINKGNVSIANMPLLNSYESAYAAYVNSKLARVALINMRQYNYTVNGTSSVINPVPRASLSYEFQVLQGRSAKVNIQRLWANGSDAITGITFDGYSYNYELNLGEPVRLRNVTVGETVEVKNGIGSVTVPDSSAVILNFDL